jgi:AAA15 family ATPase/GTPase
MIHYIKIGNFGPIRDEVELNFEAVDSEGSYAYEVEMPDKRKLLKLAYIYGANASGKTTVLQAIEF